MQISHAEYAELQHTYATARNKYKPSRINTLLITEAPPCNLERYFYFEDVKTQDSLFLEIMGVLYPDDKKRYLTNGRPTEGKAALLRRFQEDGFWLLDVYEVPGDLPPDVMNSAVPNLLKRLSKYIDKQTPVILIKTNIFDLCYTALASKGYRVSAERMPFPGSGQQKVFRQKFSKAVNF